MGLIPHEVMTTTVGGREYEFRTLSLSQVVLGQRALLILKGWVTAPDPRIAAAEDDSIKRAVADFLGIVCPEILEIHEDCPVEGCAMQVQHSSAAHITPEISSDITTFYLKRQHWRKLKTLLSEFADQPTGAQQGTESPEEAWRSFMAMCGVTASFYGISYEDFAQLRFDESADMMIALARFRRGKKADGAKSADEFFTKHMDKTGLVYIEGEAPVKFVETPDWLKDN